MHSLTNKHAHTHTRSVLNLQLVLQLQYDVLKLFFLQGVGEVCVCQALLKGFVMRYSLWQLGFSETDQLFQVTLRQNTRTEHTHPLLFFPFVCLLPSRRCCLNCTTEIFVLAHSKLNNQREEAAVNVPQREQSSQRLYNVRNTWHFLPAIHSSSL